MDYVLHLIVMVLIYSSLVVSLDLMIGHTGILSFAHASFYGIGAYATAILTVYAGINWLPAMMLAFVVGGVIAAAIAVPTLRLGGDYFILALFGFTLIVISLIINMEWLTNGPFGIRGVPRPSFFGYQVQSGVGMLVFIAVVVGLIYFVHWRFATSRMKSVLHAIRDDEAVAMSLGINVVRTRIIVFAMGGAFAALSGALAAFYFRFVTSESYGLETIILLWAMLFVGGNCSLIGSVVGPAVLVLFPELFRFVGGQNLDIAHIQTGMYGLLLILLMLYRPQGIAGGQAGLR
jgi:ABC-type branched-subunit amino acid transport system permease subunit